MSEIDNEALPAQAVYNGQPSPGSKVNILQEAGGELPDRNADSSELAVKLSDQRILSNIRVVLMTAVLATNQRKVTGAAVQQLLEAVIEATIESLDTHLGNDVDPVELMFSYGGLIKRLKE